VIPFIDRLVGSFWEFGDYQQWLGYSSLKGQAAVSNINKTMFASIPCSICVLVDKSVPAKVL